MLHIFGHTNPDTDAICSAVVAADFYAQLGYEAKAFRLGEPNLEAVYVLEQAGVDMPPLLKEVKDPIQVVLVDHNSPHQSMPNLGKQMIRGFIDHHTIENMNTDMPTFMRFEPFCSTCTILFEMYREKNFEISEPIAKLMIAGILSDSLAFRSPTTTDHDKMVADELAKQLSIDDIQAYAKLMFDAKSDLGDTAIRDIVTMDYKEFEFGSRKVAIGVLETTNPGCVMGRKGEILEDLAKLKEETSLHAVFFSVVDILEEANTMIVLSDDEKEAVESAF